jgi:hypothetical protein
MDNAEAEDMINENNGVNEGTSYLQPRKRPGGMINE